MRLVYSAINYLLHLPAGCLFAVHRLRILWAHFLGEAGHHALAQLDRRAGGGARHHEVVEAGAASWSMRRQIVAGAADRVRVHERAELRARALQDR